jgi:alanyl-tRNA synthetase
LAHTLGTTPADLPGRVSALLEELEQARKRSEALERQSARRDAERLLGQVQKVDGVQVLAARLSATSVEALREVGDYLRDKLGSGVLVLGAVLDQRPTLMAMVTPDLTEQGVSAATIVREAARVMDGGGGGRPEMAQAGGKRADKLDEALRLVPGLVRKK